MTVLLTINDRQFSSQLVIVLLTINDSSHNEWHNIADLPQPQAWGVLPFGICHLQHFGAQGIKALFKFLSGDGREGSVFFFLVL